METKLVRVSVDTHERLCKKGIKNESFNTIIERLLDRDDEYEEILDLIEADREFEKSIYDEFDSVDDLVKELEKGE